MTSSDAIADRDELRRAGERRTGRHRAVMVAVMAGLLVLIPVVLLITDHGAHPAQRVRILIFELIPAAVFLAVALSATWWLRRRHPQFTTPSLAAGAKRDTRRAVQRAIRTGHAPDARIEALAREQADKTVRNRVVIVVGVGSLVLQLPLLVLHLVDNGPTSALVLTVTAVVLLAAGVVALAVNLARSRRYLREHPSQSGPL